MAWAKRSEVRGRVQMVSYIFCEGSFVVVGVFAVRDWGVS